MNTKEFISRTRRLNKNHMMSDFFRYLKNNRTEELLMMQREQLFRKSEGWDKVKLGRYQKKNIQADSGIVRSAGEPYWMDNTGELFNKMKVKVKVTTQEILFENKRKDIDKPWFRTNEDIFGTENWFGLNEDNMAIVRGWAKQFSIIWAENMIKYGTRTTDTSF